MAIYDPNSNQHSDGRDSEVSFSTKEEIPSAESLLDGMLGKGQYPTDTPDALIEFAKLHLQAYKEAITKEYKRYGWAMPMNEEEVLSLYPEENIK